MDHGADVRHSQKVSDVVFAGLDVNLDLREARHIRKRLAITRVFIFSRCDKALASKRSDGSLGEFINVVGSLMAIVNATQLNGTLRGLGQRHSGPASFAEDAFMRNLVLFWFSTKRFSRDFLKFLLPIHGGGMGCAGHGMRGLTASGNASPGQILRGISPRKVALLPRNAQYFRNHA